MADLTFADVITFTRSSTVNAWGLDGNGDPVLQEYAIDEPVENAIDPATKESLGYRSLQGFTNSLLWSRDLSNGVWSKLSSATAVQDAEGADGAVNKASTVTDSDGASSGLVRQNVTVSSSTNTHTVRFFVKKDGDESRFPQFRADVFGASTVQNRIRLNTKTGAASSISQENGSTYSVENAGSWWELIFNTVDNGSGNGTLGHNIYPADNTELDGSGSNTTGSIVYDFGGVYLNSSIAGPPIETEGSPVSTAADDATEPLPASCQDGFVAVTHGRAPIDRSNNQCFWEVRNSTDSRNNKAYLRFGSSSVLMSVFANGTLVSNINLGAVSAEQDIKVAVVVSASSIRGSLNGSAVVSASSPDMPSGLNEKEIGDGSANGNLLNSTIAYDALYDNPADWSDADLQEATS